MTMACPLCGRRYPDETMTCSVDGSELVDISEDHAIGYQINRYRIEKQIGKGGFGVVYLARHSELGNQVAIKILRKQFVTDQQLVERFRREARVSSQINHENVVQIVDFGYDDELGFYYIMEYLDGVSLSDVMKSYPQGMPFSRLLPILRQMCAALDRAHAVGIVHRDLKPSNVFLIRRFAHDDVVKILDFGIAKVLQAEDGKGVTVTGQIVGSPRFMSPEQARGRHAEVDPRSDIYSLGVMVFWMLTGRLPFESKQLARLLFMHVKTPAPTLASLQPSRIFPASLEAAIASALSKEKEDRPSSTGEFFRRLEAASREIRDTHTLESSYPPAFAEAWNQGYENPGHSDSGDHGFHPQTPSFSAPAHTPTPLPSPSASSPQAGAALYNPQDTPSGLSYSYSYDQRPQTPRSSSSHPRPGSSSPDSDDIESTMIEMSAEPETSESTLNLSSPRMPSSLEQDVLGSQSSRFVVPKRPPPSASPTPSASSPSKASRPSEPPPSEPPPASLSSLFLWIGLICFLGVLLGIVGWLFFR